MCLYRVMYVNGTYMFKEARLSCTTLYFKADADFKVSLFSIFSSPIALLFQLSYYWSVWSVFLNV